MSEPSPASLAAHEDASFLDPSADGPASGRSIWQRLRLSIRDKIILPYLLLTLAAAVMGILIVTRLIATSFDERFTNQLLEAGRVASDGVVRQEERQLEVLRAMAQTDGIAAEMQEANISRLHELLEVQGMNANIDSIIVLDRDGNILLRLESVRNFNPEVIDDFQPTQGGNLADLPIVQPVLSGQADGRGDKYAALINGETGPLLYTSAPVYRPGDEQIVGAILVGSRLDRILARLKTEALADVIIYTAPGRPIDSTVPEWETSDQYDSLIISGTLYDHVLSMPGETPLNTGGKITLFARDYRIAYTPLILRGRATGVLAVLLPSDFIVRTISTSRTTFIIIFSVALALVVIVGTGVARLILGPISELADLVHGLNLDNLDRRARVRSSDEIGDLARSFNRMSDWLQKALHDVRDENARTLSVLGSIADGVVVTDLSGKMMMINDAARQLLGVPGDAVDDTRISVLTTLPFTSAEPVRVPFDERMISISAAQVIPKESNEVIGHVFTLRDVTREAVAERTKDSFLDQIGHEFRTPLTSIAGYAQVLKHGGDRLTDEKRTEAVNTIYDKTEEMRLIVNQLIDLAALHGGNFTLQTEPRDLVELVGAQVSAWSDDFGKARLEPSFESRGGPLMVEVDVKRINRALDAVFHNAIIFSPEGGRLSVEVHRDGDWACISISDPGVGISPKDAPYVWSRFYRGSPLDSEGNLIDVRGMGQGLHMVKTIVEAHRGQVDLLSEPGRGTTVRLCFPISA